MAVKQEEIFYCYSPNVQSYLIESGFSVIKSGIHHRTKKVFLGFEKSEELNKYLYLWKTRKH